MQFFVGIICFFVAFRLSLPKAISHTRMHMKPLKLFTLLAAVALLPAACSKDDEFPDNILFRNKADKTIYVNVYVSPDFFEIKDIELGPNSETSIRLNPGNYRLDATKFFQVTEGRRIIFTLYDTEHIITEIEAL